MLLGGFESGLKPAAIAREFRLSRAQVDSVVVAATRAGSEERTGLGISEAG